MAIFIPYGSFVYGESRDQDFFLTDKKLPLVPGAIEYERPGYWHEFYRALNFLKSQGFKDPDIYPDEYIFVSDPGDEYYPTDGKFYYRDIVISNLIVDYPILKEYLEPPSNDELISALRFNVERWNNAVSTLKTLRKRLFSQAQLECFEKTGKFINSKSKVQHYLVTKGWSGQKARSFLFEDGRIIQILKEGIPCFIFRENRYDSGFQERANKAFCPEIVKKAYRFKRGLYYNPPGYDWNPGRCEFIVKKESTEEVVSLEVIETYTSWSKTHSWSCPANVWQKMTELLLEEI